MKIGFLCLPLAGHLNPMIALARRLRSRGNEVVIFGVPDAEAFARAADLTFVPYAEDESPPGWVARAYAPVARMVGLDVLKYTIANTSPGILASALRHLPGKLAETGVEGMVIDTVHFVSQIVPMGMGIPFVQAWVILPSHPSGAAPSAFASWPHETTPEALARNADGMKQFGDFVAPMSPRAAGRSGI